MDFLLQKFHLLVECPVQEKWSEISGKPPKETRRSFSASRTAYAARLAVKIVPLRLCLHNTSSIELHSSLIFNICLT